jgi:hypothetical protein
MQINEGQQMLAQFTSQTKVLLASHFFTRETAPSHAPALAPTNQLTIA